MTERTARLLRVLFFLYVGLTFANIAYVVYREPFAFDAWNVAVDTGAQEFSIRRFFEFWHQQYTESNPRIGQPLTYFAYKLVGFAEVVTPLAFFAIVVGAFVLGTGHRPDHRKGRDLATLAFGIGLMWIAAPNFPSYLFCRAYATNYVWTAAILMWFLVVLKQQAGHSERGHPGKLAAMFAFGVVAGMCNEHTGPTLLLFTFGYAAWTWRKHHRRAWSLWAGALGTLIGFAVIFFAPGQSSRYDEFLREKLTLTQQILVRGIAGNLEILKGMLFAAAPLLTLLLAVMAVGMLSENRTDAALPEVRQRQRRAFAIIAVGLLASILITCTVFASPKLGPRFYMHPVLLLLAGMLGVTHSYLHRARAYAPFVVLAVIASIYAGFRTIPMYTRLHRDSELRLAELAAAAPGGFYTANALEQVPESWWFLGDDFRDQKKRELVASYFGLNRVLFRGGDLWKTLGITDVKLTMQYEFDDPKVCLDELEELDLKPYVGRDLGALHHAFVDAITEVQRIAPSPLRKVDLVATFLGSKPPMPRDRTYVARWAAGVLEGYVGGMKRVKRSKDRIVVLPAALAQASWDIYMVAVGDEPRLLGSSTSKQPLK